MLREALRSTRSGARRLGLSVLVVCSSSTILTSFACSWFARPFADDFSRAATAGRCGVISCVRHEYTEWSGRWAGVGLGYAAGAAIDLTSRSYGFVLMLLTTFSLLSTYALLSAVSPGLPRRVRLVMTLGFYAIYWTGMPSISEACYWLTGAIENQLSIFVALCLISGLIYLSRQSTPPHPVWYPVPALGCFVMVGMHELFGLLFILVLSVGTLVAFMSKGASRHVWLAALISAGAGLAVVVLAPGNTIRYAYTASTSTIGDKLIGLMKNLKPPLFHWIFDPRLLIASVSLLASPGILAALPALPGRWRWAVPVVSLFSVMFAIGFTSWLSLGGIPGRTWSGIYLLFLIGWFLSMRLLTSASPTESPRTSALLRQLVWAYLGLALLCAPNTRNTVRDLLSRALPFDRAVRSRFADLERIAPGDARLTPLPRIPTFLRQVDVTAQPDHWLNIGVARYFGLGSVSLDAPPRNLEKDSPPGRSVLPGPKFWYEGSQPHPCENLR